MANDGAMPERDGPSAPRNAPGAVVASDAPVQRDSVAYWTSQGVGFREMGPDEPVPPPNVIAHWVENGVAYWIVDSPGPVPVMGAMASRDIFRRKYRAAGVSPGRAARQAAQTWRHVDRAARLGNQPSVVRSRSRETAHERALAAELPDAKARQAAAQPKAAKARAFQADRGLEDRKRARSAAEAREAKARAARRAAGHDVPAGKRKEKERHRGYEQHV